MLIRSPLATFAILGLQATCFGQSPNLNVPAGVQVSLSGATPTFLLSSAQANRPFAIFADLDGGPVDLLGERFYLGLTSALVPALMGTTSQSGSAVGATSIPPIPGLAGIPLYTQAVVLDTGAPNGLFRVSNGTSTCLFNSPASISQRFDAGSLGGFTGNFSTDVVGHLRGGPVTTRTARTIVAPAHPFPPGIASPLQPSGCRQQVVYRPGDLGSTGQPERIVAMRWRAVGQVVPDTFPSMTIRMAHSSITPNYAVDPFSQLPVAPNSGLGTSFSDNEQLGDPSSVVYAGSYVIDPANVLAGNYVPYPMLSTFDYDGESSLMIDFRVPPSSALGLNGMSVNLMVQSSPLPGARCVAAGTASAPVNPGTVATGTPDNAMPDFEFVFARTSTFAQSPWIASNVPNPDYDTPIVAQSLPAGTSIAIEYRGGSVNGNNPTAWSSSPDIADGRSHLQYRITFVANHITGERPLIDTLLVPIH